MLALSPPVRDRYKNVTVLEGSNNIGGRARATHVQKKVASIGAWHFRACDLNGSVLSNLLKSLNLESGLRTFEVRGKPYTADRGVPGPEAIIAIEDADAHDDNAGSLLARPGGALRQLDSLNGEITRALHSYEALRRTHLGSGSAQLPRMDVSVTEGPEGISFLELVKKKRLEVLIPAFELSNAINGLGELADMPAYYGLLWHTPDSIEFVEDTVGTPCLVPVYRGAMLPTGIATLLEAMIAKQSIEVLCGVTITTVQRTQSDNPRRGNITYLTSKDGPCSEEFDLIVFTNNFAGVSPLLSDLDPKETTWTSEVRDRTLAVTLFTAEPPIDGESSLDAL